MAVPAPRQLSLPEEFVLLSHLPSGKVHGTARAAIGCAAAEVGELALRRKLLLRTRKFRKLGFDIYRTHGVEIELLDTGPTGLAWADESLSELRRRCSASGNGRCKLLPWLRHRHGAFSLHRDALAGRGALIPTSGGIAGLFGAKQRHHPHPELHGALVAELRAAGAEHARIDEHMLFLRDIVETVRLGKELGVPASMRDRLDRARGIGGVELVPEELRDTSAALISLVPSHDNDTRYRRPRV
ncbi:GPP34 family phosphoprotein [Streptomyces winkii]|uniref:GPP34 family phosphoprotein n=1 Tax=Streptomyces winkii TaxID=3051178 RepID=UPI0028D6F0DD|nr:GPP34 family phosphoprotein [Streptomyces sp. DSM 40971]